MPERPWHLAPMALFDLETTGVDVEKDRVVTGTVIDLTPGQPPKPRSWLANPGVPIPPSATKIHGITDEMAAQGQDLAEALDQICAALAAPIEDGRPIVGMNLCYDLTLLDRNCRAFGVEPLIDRCRGVIAPVIDIYILDQRLVPKRRGQGARRLGALCEAWKVRHGGAHNSTEDALAAARIAYRMAQQTPWLAGTPPMDLHAMQVEWKKTQDGGLAAYFLKTAVGLDQAGKTAEADRLRAKAATCDGIWPIRLPDGEPPAAVECDDPWCKQPEHPNCVVAGGLA